MTLPGADGEQFQILLFIFSSLVFVFGDYVVALLPKLLPGSVLVWLSAELMAFWVWNSLRFLRAYEYCLVWVMILMCLGRQGAALASPHVSTHGRIINHQYMDSPIDSILD